MTPIGLWLFMVFTCAFVRSDGVTAGASSTSGSVRISDGQGGAYGTSYNSDLNSQYPQTYSPAFPYTSTYQGYQPQFNAFNGGYPYIPSYVPIPYQPFHFAPLPPFVAPPQFNNALSEYIKSVQGQYANHNGGGSFAYSTPGASAYALTKLGPSNIFSQQQNQWDAWKNQIKASAQQYYPPNVAIATGIVGPSGVYQSVKLHPENANSPNVETRFGASGNPNGYVGVHTASFSSSTVDENGVPTHRKGAITTVNDNGKITTYQLD